MQEMIPNVAVTGTVPALESDRIVTLTAKGEAVRTVYRLVHLLVDLDVADREAVLETLNWSWLSCLQSPDPTTARP
jgi:hypothetical protein